MVAISAHEPSARAIVSAIQEGDVPDLERLLEENSTLAGATIVDAGGCQRSLLHIATDYPGNFPNGPQTVRSLIRAGADVNARFVGPHEETPLHWAASTDDVAVVDALIEQGADLEASGSVIVGTTALANAAAFGQWRAARRLLEHGAQTNLWQAAALGLTDRVEQALEAGASPEELTNALWCACHGGQRAAAQMLLEHGADRDWVGHDGLTPLDAAERSEATELAAWLRDSGAASARGKS
jgi:ankyrin repeat protein